MSYLRRAWLLAPLAALLIVVSPVSIVGAGPVAGEAAATTEPATTEPATTDPASTTTPCPGPGCDRATAEEIAARRAALAAARAKWEAAGIEDYAFTLRRQCFCFTRAIRRVEIEVRNGRAHGGGHWYKKQNTIDELFGEIEDHIKGAGFEVRYGSRYGIPREMFFDTSLAVADEEVGYVVRSFRPQIIVCATQAGAASGPVVGCAGPTLP